jgi:hypothetical protein
MRRRRGRKAVAFVAAAAGRAIALVPIALATACGVALYLRFRKDPDGAAACALGALGEWAVPGLPGARTIYFACSDGGFFPGAVAFVAMLLARLYAIAMNPLRDRVRRSATEACALERAHAGDAVATVGNIETTDDRATLQQAMAKLNEDEREPRAFQYGGDLSVREAARVARVSRTTLERRPARALPKLRDELG